MTTKIVAGYDVPAGISDELEAGIKAYRARIEAIGGYGTRIRAHQPDGSVREGSLIEAGYGGGQPAVICDGKRYAIGWRYVHGERVECRVEACADGEWRDVEV